MPAPGYVDCFGLWTMNESAWNGTPGEVIDGSGKGNHGVRLVNATTAESGKIKRCGTFDGASAVDVGTMGDFGSLMTGELIIAAWFKMTSTASQFLMGSVEAGGMYLEVYLNYGTANGAGRLRCSLRDDDNSLLQAYKNTNLGFTNGNWHFLLVEFWKSEHMVSVFLDNALIIPLTYSSSGTGCNFVNFTYPLYLGARNLNGSMSLPYTGQLDAIMIFNKIITEGEDIWLWNNRAGKELASLAPMVHHYKQMAGAA